MAFIRRFTQEASNAVSDAYGSLVLGDDAGKSARLVLVLRPHQVTHKGRASSALQLGMTFLDINGRAYVQMVVPGSEADKAGVLPRDSVQFAAVVSQDWQLGSTDVTGEDLEKVSSRYALMCETKGQRISYEELRRLLGEGLDSSKPAFLSPNSPRGLGSTGQWSPPPIPSTINVCTSNEERRPMSPFRGENPRPVVFVFRRTRQRRSPYFSILPSFRIDDECDFASTLVKRLAPTDDMDFPYPDVWEEFVHDGTDWLLGNGSILPPRNDPTARTTTVEECELQSDGAIPLDSFERERSKKLAALRSHMAAEAMAFDRTDDVEAATIRGMIQKAVGLAFVRASKVVLGVSFHGGSGIVIARLSDGTWSAPSAIGTVGIGLGIQFGLEVADYIFILQTQESLDHFMKGGSFTVGGNVGAAVAGMGREAYGAASVGGVCGSENQIKDDEYNDQASENQGAGNSSVGIAPIVAYAKSQGLYVGVSLEGSRIFPRDDINCRTYKFSSGRDVSAYDILSGKVPTPSEAEDLYAALHSVEFTHEMSCLPRPPEILRKDSPNSWYFDRNTLGLDENCSPRPGDPFTFLSTLSERDAKECTNFETQFKKFMYGGVSVQRLIPNSESRSGRTRRERRTLWLMLPEVGSLRLGFVSKLSDEEGAVSNKSSTQRVRRDESDAYADLGTVASEEVTLDSALLDKENGSTLGQIRTGNVELSSKHSVALTDVTLLSDDPQVKIKFKQEDQTEHLRVISIKDVDGTSLLFLANNFREAELLLCGLKLLLERETTRLGVRGGMRLASLSGRSPGEGAMSPAAARGILEPSLSLSPPQNRSHRPSGYSSSEVEDHDSVGDVSLPKASSVPEGWSSWGRVPGRRYMRGQASSASFDSTNDEALPRYVHGQLLVRDICKNVHLPLPLPLCRVLLLDSSSPVITQWEDDRGDVNFEKTPWTFPPATPREAEHHQSEHQLIASGSMCGAHRTTSFERHRNGVLVRLSETQIVESDDAEKLSFSISELMPRRGFSIKVKILLRPTSPTSSEATILGEIRPVGKNMSNQTAVHKAFTLVVDELRGRYGSNDIGLMAGFVNVVETMAENQNDKSNPNGSFSNTFLRNGQPMNEEKKESDHMSSSANERSGLTSFEDILKTPSKKVKPESNIRLAKSSTPSLMHLQANDPDPVKKYKTRKPEIKSDEFEKLPGSEGDGGGNPLNTSPKEREPVMIEVKPLPKIRLSLMPSPREEDEEIDDDSSSQQKNAKKKKKKSSRRSGTWRKSSKTILSKDRK